jgi:broad specificity phosphatase PhoE
MNLLKILKYISLFITSLVSRLTLISRLSLLSKPTIEQKMIMTSSSTTTIQTFDISLVRHGETTANRDGILQGHCDYPLTDKGINEAKLVGIQLNQANWDYIYCSDLKRASDTCKLLLSSNRINPDTSRIEYTNLLREISFGVREALSKDITTDEAKVIVAKKLGIAIEDVIDSAESVDAVQARQQLFINKLIELPFNDKINNILVVSHGGYIKAFLRDFCLIHDMEKIKNCSISKIRLKINKLDNSVSFECDRSNLNMVNHIKDIELV